MYNNFNGHWHHSNYQTSAPRQSDRSTFRTDYGPNPFVVDIEKTTENNNNYRSALWTGNHLQLTLMSIPVGGEIGLEFHPDTDQFIRIEEGRGIVQMGNRRDNLTFQQPVYEDIAIFVPAGTWHNLINTGNKPIKLYAVYAPPHHPSGVVEYTREMGEAKERYHQGHYPMNPGNQFPY